ncbi:MAG TPA: DUF4158 domain-containing protein, partial [Solirubrobacteraceae bacterium]|nr:DUF4158 domain-containing protein [Solirubrobacteraceae bacterium]
MTATGSAGGVPGGLVPAEELERLSSWPVEVARSDLAAYFSFSLADLRWLRSHRGAGERIGLAVQLGAVRFLGFVPVALADTPPEVAGHVGKQIGVAPATFRRYARDTDGRTRRRHVAAVVEHAGWRACGQREWSSLAGWLTERALEHDTPTILFGQALDQLRAERVVRPGLDRLMRAVSSARVNGRKEIRRRFRPELTPERCEQLDGLLVTDPELGIARLVWL